MDQIKELEKYKALLDSGAISDEEFGKLKKKLLGLKSDEEKELEMQQERAEALAELERLRAEENAEKEAVAQAEQEQFRLAQAEKDRKNQEIKAKEEQEQYQKTFVAEKMIEDLWKLSQKLGRTPSIDELTFFGLPSDKSYQRYFEWIFLF